MADVPLSDQYHHAAFGAWASASACRRRCLSMNHRIASGYVHFVR